MTLLDVGCGPGTITADLATLVAPGRVVAVDSAQPILDQAAAHAAEAGCADGIEFAVGDVHELEFPDDTFDVVHAHQVLQHVTNPVKALREMRRVCKPGGIVAARDGDYSGFVWYPRLPALDAWLRLYLDLARANGGEPDAGRYLLTWAHEAGFEDVTASSSTWWLRRGAGPAMVGRAMGGPGHQVAVRRRRGGQGPGHRAGTARVVRGLARLGRRPGRLAVHPARRDPLPCVNRLPRLNRLPRG